jgi:hypothetical protein
VPTPGPRTQWAPVPGYNNPEREDPDRFNNWHRPGPVIELGRSPGTSQITLRGNMLGAGTIRALWRQSVNLVAGQAPYSWTSSRPAPGEAENAPPRPFGITRALRYMTRSVYVAAGTDNSRLAALHTVVHPHARGKAVSVPAGAVRSRPTIRNRMTSFGSRIPPMNGKAPGAQ